MEHGKKAFRDLNRTKCEQHHINESMENADLYSQSILDAGSSKSERYNLSTDSFLYD